MAQRGDHLPAIGLDLIAALDLAIDHALHGLAEIAGHLIEGLVLAGQDIEVRLMLASLAEVLADHLLDRVMDLIGILLHVLQEFTEDFIIRLLAAMEHGENVVQKIQQLADLLVLLMEAIKDLRHGS